MQNFGKISRKIKKFFSQGLALDRSVCMAAICYSSPIVTIFPEIVSSHKTILYSKFREDISTNKSFL